MSTGRASWIFLVFGIAVTSLQLGLLPDHGFWTPDDGNKYLIGRAADSSILRPALPYLGRELDPELRWAPIRTPFAHVVDGRLVSQYPPAFSLLSRLVDRDSLGKAHLFIPFLGSLLVLSFVGWLGPCLGAPRSLSLLLAWPLSPLLFYGTLHWEHTLVAALVTLALGILVRDAHANSSGIRGSFLVGACLAIATGLREETVLVFVALALVLGRSHRSFLARTALAYVGILLPFVLWQWIGTGSLIGLHFRGNLDVAETGFLSWMAARGDVVRALLFSTLPLNSLVGVTIGSLFLGGGVAGLVLFGTRPSERGSRFRSVSLATVFLGIAMLALGAWWTLHGSLQPIVLVRCSGLLLFAPWIVFALVPLQSPSLRTLRSVVGVSLLLFLLATPTISASGVHWGPRILLSLLPSAAWISAAGLVGAWRNAVGAGLPWHTKRRTVLGLFGGLSILAVLFLQISGLSLQRRSVEAVGVMREQTRTAIAGSASEELRPRPAASVPIVTHLWWYAQVFAPLTLERPIYQVRSRDDFLAWFRAFAREEPKRFFLATAAPDYEILRGLPLRVRPVAEIMDPRQPTLRHWLLEVERTPEPEPKRWWRFYAP